MKNIEPTQSKKLAPAHKPNLENLVVQSNELIQASYAMTLNEQRLLLACISQIDSRQTLESGEEFVLTVEQAQDLFYNERNAKNAYRDLETAAEKLFERKVRIDLGGNETLLTRFVQSVRFNPDSKQVSIEFANKIMPYLSQLEANFTKYRLANVVQLTSSYAVRIYELLVSWAGQGLHYKKMEIEELRELLMLDGKYKQFGELNSRVLSPALEQINDSTDFTLKVSFQKRGRSYKWIQLDFRRKAEAIAEEEAKKARKIAAAKHNEIAKKARLSRDENNAKQRMNREEIAAQKSILPHEKLFGAGTELRGIKSGNLYILPVDDLLPIKNEKNYQLDGLSAMNNHADILQRLIQDGMLEIISLVAPLE